MKRKSNRTTAPRAPQRPASRKIPASNRVCRDLAATLLTASKAAPSGQEADGIASGFTLGYVWGRR